MPLKSYGQWMYERTQAGLPVNVPPPIDVEPYHVWFERMRGLKLGQGLQPKATMTKIASGPNPPSQRVRNLRGLAARFFG